MWWTNQKKLVSSAGLAVLALALALLSRKPCCWLAASAMALSTLGDGVLAGYPKLFSPVKNRLTKGGLIFFAAHILYILALITASGPDAASLLPHFWAPFSAFAAMTVLHGIVFYFRAASRPSLGFFSAAFFYLLAVSVHAGAAVCLFAQLGIRFLPNAVGAVLFFLSDAILLAHKYGFGKGKHVSDLIWFTYVPGQLCLILGFFLA
ncbi:MAG: hypothetical protein IK099_00005 [Clostridia bacterium]|nr:hypothetical protein [Clostridia bacterium]